MIIEKMFTFLAFFIVRLLGCTHRLRYENSKIVRDCKKNGKNVIFAFWHGKSFMLVNSHKNRGITIITSLSKDGRLQASVLNMFGYKTVSGSSNKGGDRALVSLIRSIKQGSDVAFAVDGSRGPIYKSKQGVVYLAKKVNVPIIPVAVAAKSFWQLNSWDKYNIPKPFTEVVVCYGEPIYVGNDDDIEDKLLVLDNKLNSLQINLNNKLQIKRNL